MPEAGALGDIVLDLKRGYNEFTSATLYDLLRGGLLRGCLYSGRRFTRRLEDAAGGRRAIDSRHFASIGFSRLIAWIRDIA